MAYEDTNCNCGGRKRIETMLCDQCLAAFADRHELRDLSDESLSVGYRRSAAILLLSMSRRRSRFSPTSK